MFQTALYQEILDFHKVSDINGAEIISKEELIGRITALSEDYLNAFFPLNGTQLLSAFEMIQLLTASNPDSRISSLVAQNGGFNPCEGSDGDQIVTYSCPEGSVKNPDSPYCYKQKFSDDCYDPIKLISFSSDQEVTGLITLLKEGE